MNSHLLSISTIFIVLYLKIKGSDTESFVSAPLHLHATTIMYEFMKVNFTVDNHFHALLSYLGVVFYFNNQTEKLTITLFDHKDALCKVL